MSELVLRLPRARRDWLARVRRWRPPPARLIYDFCRLGTHLAWLASAVAAALYFTEPWERGLYGVLVLMWIGLVRLAWWFVETDLRRLRDGIPLWPVERWEWMTTVLQAATLAVFCISVFVF